MEEESAVRKEKVNERNMEGFRFVEVKEKLASQTVKDSKICFF